MKENQPQRQDSLTDQLRDVGAEAVRMGCYDAATFIEDVLCDWDERPWVRWENLYARELYPRIREWIEAGMPPAQTAFTEGLERTVAQLYEEAVRANSPASE